MLEKLADTVHFCETNWRFGRLWRSGEPGRFKENLQLRNVSSSSDHPLFLSFPSLYTFYSGLSKKNFEDHCGDIKPETNYIIMSGYDCRNKCVYGQG